MSLAERWFAALGRWQRFFLALGAGALMTAGHAPVSLPWVIFLSLPVLALLVLNAPTGRAAGWIGWAAGFGYFVTGLHWIGHAFLVDADRFAWLMPLGVAALPAGLALFWALAFWLSRRIVTRTGGGPSGVLVLAIVWSVAEFARGHVLTGFPWALPGYIWVDTPVMQIAAFIGPYALTLLTLAVTALSGYAAATGRSATAAVALGLGAALWIGGSARLPDAPYLPDVPEGHVVRLVQPNAPQHLKWQPGHREEFYRRALEATAGAADADLGAPDIVIWPETAVTFVPAAQPAEVARITEAAGGATVLLGALHGEVTAAGSERWSNAMVSILPSGALGPRYDKHHLVPFGEYLPFQAFFDMLGLSQFAIRGGFARGPGPQTVTIDGVPPFSALICYEAIFPHQIVGAERPDWLVQPTNDAWFGTFAGPRQHYAQARIRAIEQGLPMVRAANTGISAVVDAYGLEVVSLNMHNSGYIDALLPLPLPPTLYSRFGDLLFLFMIVFIAIFAISLRYLPRSR